MTGCTDVVGLLLEYLEGRLPPETQASLEQHLAGCESCVTHVRTYRSTISLLRSLRDEDLPPELRLSLHTFLDDQPQR